ncbi:MAG: methylated-DNA--[protein]-cysteine S-methyltransferase [Muribaculaceae bacterium]|nr:methylated-DNA--[protein]-cysteine S-methyltransferase [Muribaculaceae bacterium]
MNRIIYFRKYYSPVGNLILGDYNNQLCMCDWINGKKHFINSFRLKQNLNVTFEEGDTSILTEAFYQLGQYFTRRLSQFHLPLYLCGSDFQKKVWHALMSINYNEITTYREIARRIGHPTSVRAVANAIGSNPISIIIPCHRVIGSNGSMTGYAGGIEIKKALIDLESGLYLQ